MAEIVNLRQARKHKARQEKEKVAERNRAIHGRAKAERETERLLSQKTERFLDAHRRMPKGE
ncbi:DUF4169 family protein [Manganibacter manganicus]|uniref:DUF4169 domain-containing protein n=1 Tax=Manganibacter manganicus TaxID=1873176 RepID=A0A1V8RW06_9HYPH|nr:DUF4169 family protein [Pseudaminobacter manganicus]OQM77376.1 hypothetical protein BFN67_00570 [Pseudaminobacter manganicus]